MNRRHELFINGGWQKSDQQTEIKSPFHQKVVALADQANLKQMQEAIQATLNASKTLAKSSRFVRSKLLSKIATGIENHRQELLDSMILEAGKPNILADGEINRAIQTFTWAAEEVKRFGGEIIPMDVDSGGRSFLESVCLFKARGPVLGITPFNFPLNLVAHKVAPALAAGCPIIIKSAPQAPGGAAILAKIFEWAVRESADSIESIPLASLQVISCSNDVAEAAIKDPRIPTVSFTGSPGVGFKIQQMAVGKKVILELGGNAAVIIHQDADLKRAASRCAFGGMTYAGQTCISVQRIFVHKSIAAEFQKLLVIELERTKTGDPSLKDTIVGPVIDDRAANRIENWIKESKAKVLTGGIRSGNVIQPTLVLDPPSASAISCEEVFGPVVTLSSFDRIEEAFQMVNDSKFGLQAGIFTCDSKVIYQAFEELEVGGLIINEVPTFRADHMPYGGVKQSGLGREGLKYAMEELSERRILVQFR